MTTVLVSGGSGLVGRHLCRKLQEKGYTVAILTRKKLASSPYIQYVWNVEEGYIEQGAIENAHFIVHLAGENIGGKRWTGKRKKELLESRTKTAALICKKVTETNRNLGAFVSASAIGYYGALTTDKLYTEEDAAAADFIGNLCREWEAAADQFAALGIRTVKIRTALVCTAHKGALESVVKLVRSGFGSPIGNGRQYMPWIHIDDLCAIYVKAIEDAAMTGAFNAAAPEAVTNRMFMKTLAEVLNKPFWFPGVPKFLMKLVFGQMACILTEGSRVSPDKIIRQGFTFRYPKLRQALQDLFPGTPIKL